MRIDFINRPTQALSAAAAVLTLTIVLELLYPAQPTNLDLASAETAAAVVPDFGDTDFTPPRFQDLGDMLDRPLFFSDRKLPEPPTVEAAPVAAATPLRLKLEGVAIAGESRVAVLRDLGNNQLLQLAEGIMHDGWTLDSVTAAGAKFSRGQQISELVLDPNSDSRR
jgi:hypothetical protein